MKLINLIFVIFFCSISAQKNLPFDSLKIKETKELFADDYGNIYLYKNKDFSFTKYDSLGNHKGRMMFTLPFKIQNVQNPMNIVMFSENAQEIKFADQNLNEIQKIDLWKFGFVKMAYAEDLQQIWLLDESMKRLVQYNFREDKIINSFPFQISFDEVKDLLVFEGRVYLIQKNNFKVFDFKGNEIFSQEFSDPKKLRRENERIYIISEKQIDEFLSDSSVKTVFTSGSAQIVDKNSSAYFEIRDNKVYLYKLDYK